MSRSILKIFFPTFTADLLVSVWHISGFVRKIESDVIVTHIGYEINRKMNLEFLWVSNGVYPSFRVTRKMNLCAGTVVFYEQGIFCRCKKLILPIFLYFSVRSWKFQLRVSQNFNFGLNHLGSQSHVSFTKNTINVKNICGKFWIIFVLLF